MRLSRPPAAKGSERRAAERIKSGREKGRADDERIRGVNHSTWRFRLNTEEKARRRPRRRLKRVKTGSRTFKRQPSTQR